MSNTIFDRFGGAGAVDAAVDLFYEKVLADKRINQYLTKTEMTRQRNHQKRFLTQAFGGPAHYSGRMMRAAHKYLNRKEADFNALADNLIATLRELKVPESLINESIQIVAASKADVRNL